MSEQSVSQKKEQILQAALAAYARYGIASATTRQIAEIAGIGKSTIFEYFKSSEELMEAAFAWYIGQITANRATLHALATTDPAAALSRYFDDLTELILREPDKMLLISQYATVILSSSHNFSDVKQEYARKLQPASDAVLEEFRHIAEAGIANGAFQPRGANAADCAYALSAIAREMQAQAFVQEDAQIRSTCQRLKRLALLFLGATTDID